MSRAAGLLAIAVFGIVLTWVFNRQLDRAPAATQAPADLLAAVNAQRQKLAGIVIPEGTPDATAAAVKHAVCVAFVA